MLRALNFEKLLTFKSVNVLEKAEIVNVEELIFWIEQNSEKLINIWLVIELAIVWAEQKENHQNNSDIFGHAGLFYFLETFRGIVLAGTRSRYKG